MWRSPNSFTESAEARSDESKRMANINIEIELDDAPWDSSLSLACDDEDYGRIPSGASTTRGEKGSGVLGVP